MHSFPASLLLLHKNVFFLCKSRRISSKGRKKHRRKIFCYGFSKTRQTSISVLNEISVLIEIIRRRKENRSERGKWREEEEKKIGGCSLRHPASVIVAAAHHRRPVLFLSFSVRHSLPLPPRSPAACPSSPLLLPASAAARISSAVVFLLSSAPSASVKRLASFPPEDDTILAASVASAAPPLLPLLLCRCEAQPLGLLLHSRLAPDSAQFQSASAIRLGLRSSRLFSGKEHDSTAAAPTSPFLFKVRSSSSRCY